MKTNVCYLGNCLDVLPTLPSNSVDSIVTDPPYHLVSIVKRFGKEGSAPAKFGTDGAFKRASTGFMGKTWDGGDIAFNPDMWRECLRVLKPGGHLLSFSGTRTYHRMAVAIEDAGFEVRDMITWNYGQGFPKSLNIKLNIDKQLDKLYTTICQQLPVLIAKNNFTEAHLTSSEEYFVVESVEQNSQQQKQNAKFVVKNLSKKIAKLNNQNTIIAERYVKDLLKESLENKIKEEEAQRTWLLKMLSLKEMDINANFVELIENLKLTILNQLKTFQNSDTTLPTESLIATNVIITEYIMECLILNTVDILKEINKQLNQGLGTALKPSIEPICFARKPLNAKNISENVLKYGTGGINIDESRVEYAGESDDRHTKPTKVGKGVSTPSIILTEGRDWTGSLVGRFPANLIHDNSEEVRECFPDAKGWSSQKHNNFNPYGGNALNESETTRDGFHEGYNDSGNASRFFKSILYYPKASKSERNKGMDELEAKPMYKADGSSESLEIFGTTDGGREDRKNFHPTVKPVALMSYLIKMITPKGGIVLDPFAGSGSTLVAARDNGFQYIGIEMTEEYLPIIQARTGCEVIKDAKIVAREIQEEQGKKLEKALNIVTDKIFKKEVNKKQICPTCQLYMKDGKCQYCK